MWLVGWGLGMCVVVVAVYPLGSWVNVEDNVCIILYIPWVGVFCLGEVKCSSDDLWLCGVFVVGGDLLVHCATC